MKKLNINSITVYFLVSLISIVGLRRLILLSSPPSGNPASVTTPFPQHKFADYPVLTTVHIVSGMVFLLAGTLQFSDALRARRKQLHRSLGRVLMILGIVNGVTAILMGFVLPISGVSETGAVTLFGLVFMFSLFKAYFHIVNQNIVLHREWMIRAYSIGLSVATTRIITGLFFATRSITGLSAEDFFGTALWIGFTLHFIGAEYWINRTRSQRFHS